MFIVYMLLWFIFNERVTLEIALIGLVIALAVDVFSWRILGGVKHRRFKIHLSRIGAGISYGWFLLKEIFRCNAGVIRFILSPSMEPEPELHSFRTSLKTDAARVALANSITLTPGTITCTLEDDRFLVHALDCSMAEGIEKSEFEQRLMKMEAMENAD